MLYELTISLSAAGSAIVSFSKVLYPYLSREKVYLDAQQI